MKLVERCAGQGRLVGRDQVVREVRYAIEVHQGVLEGSGLPVPGLRTITGSLDAPGVPAHGSDATSSEFASLVGADLTLQLEDGRRLGITLTDADGCVAARGVGPGGPCC